MGCGFILLVLGLQKKRQPLSFQAPAILPANLLSPDFNCEFFGVTEMYVWPEELGHNPNCICLS